ncbi:bactofilin family protein [Methyloversatilis universalis]|uniref:bactofilin family protein n=1 Tax=Methyloversatilis universalis TaxID=378211 RepID=UPI000372F371|nr:polymer-forming cytoskeletal protein [Methyloversatilis universalis]
MFGMKPEKPSKRIDSLIGAGTRVNGDIHFRGGLRIDGEVIGNVRADDNEPSTLVLSEHARIEGAVTVTHAMINGSVQGPIVSTEFLELQPQARITGDVVYNRLEVHLGAIVKGQLEHQEAAPRAVELKLASAS